MTDPRSEYRVEIDRDLFATMLLEDPDEWPNPVSKPEPIEGFADGDVAADALTLTVISERYSEVAQIDWGDSTSEAFVSPAVHTYSAAGTYTVTLDPDAEDEPNLTQTVELTDPVVEGEA